MTFTQIVEAVKARLNLTSQDADRRIGWELDDRYRRVTSTIGLQLTRRTTVSAAVTIGVSTLTFTGIEKVLNVVDRTSSPYRVLKELDIEEMRNLQAYPDSDTPDHWAVLSMGASSVTIEFDAVPATGFTLYADGISNLSALSGNDVPAFPQDFHDILIHGVLADEYRKKEKLELAKDAELMYLARLSDLRMFIAASGYKDLMQGKHPNEFDRRWWRSA